MKLILTNNCKKYLKESKTNTEKKVNDWSFSGLPSAFYCQICFPEAYVEYIAFNNETHETDKKVHIVVWLQCVTAKAAAHSAIHFHVANVFYQSSFHINHNFLSWHKINFLLSSEISQKWHHKHHIFLKWIKWRLYFSFIAIIL